MASEEGFPVDLYIYDLTNGLANLLSPAIIGRQVEGVWHTAVVAYEREFYYGSGGVTSCAPGSTQLGAPHQVERLGTTFVPFQVFVDYIQGLATSNYVGSAYHLLEHNCNHFSEEVAMFLCGAHVPKHIVQQAQRDLPPALRAALLSLLGSLVPTAGQNISVKISDHLELLGMELSSDLNFGNTIESKAQTAAKKLGVLNKVKRYFTSEQLFKLYKAQAVYASGVRHSRRDSPDFLTLNNQIEQARIQSAELEQRRSTLAEKLARKERKKEKKRKKERLLNGEPEEPEEMAEALEPSAAAELAGTSVPREPDARRADEARRNEAQPPIVYRDLDAAQEFEKLSKALEGVDLSAEEKQSLDELQQYMVQGEGSWVLGDDFLVFVGRLLSADMPAAVRTCVMSCLCVCALRDDVSLLLHADRRHHALMQHAHAAAGASDQGDLRPVALFMCNLFENISSSEWLLYISEWQDGTEALSNIRVTTKVCVNSLLSEEPELRELGTALLYNIAGKERFRVGKSLRDLLPRHARSKVFDEVCVELCMAALQLLSQAPSEPHLHRALRALAALAAHAQDVPQLIAMVGPDPAAFRGTSARVDEQIDLIISKLK